MDVLLFICIWLLIGCLLYMTSVLFFAIDCTIVYYWLHYCLCMTSRCLNFYISDYWMFLAWFANLYTDTYNHWKNHQYTFYCHNIYNWVYSTIHISKLGQRIEGNLKLIAHIGEGKDNELKEILKTEFTHWKPTQTSLCIVSCRMPSAVNRYWPGTKTSISRLY